MTPHSRSFRKRVWHTRRPLGARPRGLYALLLLLAGAALGACASAPTRVLIALPPSPVPERPFTQDSASSPLPVLLVRRLTIPEYMTAPKVRYWSSTATLAEWPDTYWAERVEIGMAREFVSALRRRLPGWTVCDASCGDTPPDIILKVELRRLDVERREHSVSASTQAEISGPKAATLASQSSSWGRSFDIPMSSDSAQGEARAMSDLLGVLAESSVAAIQNAGGMPHVGTGSARSPPD